MRLKSRSGCLLEHGRRQINIRSSLIFGKLKCTATVTSFAECSLVTARGWAPDAVSYCNCPPKAAHGVSSKMCIIVCCHGELQMYRHTHTFSILKILLTFINYIGAISSFNRCRAPGGRPESRYVCLTHTLDLAG